jgi:hypothetical protein
VAVLIGSGRRELARHTVLSPVPAGIDVLWTPEIERQRLAALAAHNAGWIRNAIAGR